MLTLQREMERRIQTIRMQLSKEQEIFRRLHPGVQIARNRRRRLGRIGAFGFGRRWSGKSTEPSETGNANGSVCGTFPDGKAQSGLCVRDRRRPTGGAKHQQGSAGRASDSLCERWNDRCGRGKDEKERRWRLTKSLKSWMISRKRCSQRKSLWRILSGIMRKHGAFETV